jgi:hypothetical protein
MAKISKQREEKQMSKTIMNFGSTADLKQSVDKIV